MSTRARTLLALPPLLVVLVLVAWPVFAVLRAGLSVESLELLTRTSTWRILGYTAAQAILSTLISLALALPAAHVLYRRRIPLRRSMLALITVPFVLPTVVVGLAFRELLPFAGTTAAIIVAHVFFNVGLVVRVVGSLWAHLDPRLTEVSASLGISPTRTFWRVTLPLLRPALAAAGTLVFLFTFTSFGVVLVVGDPAWPTVEVEIYRRAVQLLDLDGAAVLALLQLIVVALAIGVSSVLQSRLRTAHVPREYLPRPRGRGDRVAAAWTAVLTVAIAVPMVNLLVRSLRVGDSWGLAWYAEAFAPSDTSTRGVAALEAIGLSLRYAALATLIAVALGLLAAVAISGLGRASAAVDTAVTLPLGVSAVTIGFGLLLASLTGPIDMRGWTFLVPLGQALVAMPVVVRVVLPVLRSVDPRLRQVAATLGASPVRAWWTVDGVQTTRAAAVAAGLAAAVALGEFGATAFLVRADTPTMPVQIVRLLGRPGEANLGQALVLAVLLTAITLVIVAAAERIRPARSTGW